ncbi:hypothetical protein GCM10025868_10220 [Angustibacter aerolatus]|uniref:Uncharacterized protein n=1 Tax=Angustibacter aerolatus TaxID=1162965 RepID=A0ABQ6JFS2_9ACTN|nr:hypothetical protein GCM10025868_10220 [Angustibacter aerolatus]
MVVRGGVLEPPVQDVGQPAGALVGAQRERRHHLERQRGDHPDGAEPEPRRLEQRLARAAGGDRAVGQHQLEAAHLRRQPAERGTGAVRAGGDRAAERLHVDVAEVRHRQAVPLEPRG